MGLILKNTKQFFHIPLWKSKCLAGYSESNYQKLLSAGGRTVIQQQLHAKTFRSRLKKHLYKFVPFEMKILLYSPIILLALILPCWLLHLSIQNIFSCTAPLSPSSKKSSYSTQAFQLPYCRLHNIAKEVYFTTIKHHVPKTHIICKEQLK